MTLRHGSLTAAQLVEQLEAIYVLTAVGLCNGLEQLLFLLRRQFEVRLIRLSRKHDDFGAFVQRRVLDDDLPVYDFAVRK